jgi:TM2 domain-containing membrane protein YozV
MADFEELNEESGQAVAVAGQDEYSDDAVGYDVDLGNNIEFEVETEPAEQPAYEERSDYDRSYRYGGYEEQNEDYGGFFRGRERTVARRWNKHIFTWVLSFLLGMYGADRFARGQIGLGLLKLMTFGGLGFWYMADVVIAALKSYAGGYRDVEDLMFDDYGQYIY